MLRLTKSLKLNNKVPVLIKRYNSSNNNNKNDNDGIKYSNFYVSESTISTLAFYTLAGFWFYIIYK